VHDVARIGGIALFLALLCLHLVLSTLFNHSILLSNLLLTALPVFTMGLIEDLTKRVSPKLRLLASFMSAALAAYLMGHLINQTHIALLDYLLAYSVVAYLLTLFAVAGVINSINLIDGFNGLASMVCLLICLSIAYVALQYQDYELLLACVATVGAILGFFVWNYPKGLIFLGDGGAYLLGFLIVQLSIALVVRHPSVSPWYMVLLLIYPIMETLFSIYRRKIIRGISPTMPDGVHLHMLIYKRLIRFAFQKQLVHHNKQYKQHYTIKRNAATSPYLWLLSSAAVVPATLFYKQTWLLQAFCLLFVVSYVWLYWRIVKFKSPQSLIYRIKHKKKFKEH
jgi:UDP-N-acetylmuramyl pentapeptide phosphotransferase/UDP-N-acetylglucosamine-1-phosphate transferase